jgi:hypothetical protein
MPAWLISLLVSLAVKVGVPILIKKLPWIPKEVVDIITKLIEDLEKAPTPESKKEAKALALKQVRAHCSGVACPTDTKGI